MGDAMNRLLGTPGPYELPPDVMRRGSLSPSEQQFVSGQTAQPMVDPIADVLGGMTSTAGGRAVLADALLDRPAGLSLKTINWTADAPPAFVEAFSEKLPQIAKYVHEAMPAESEAVQRLVVKGPKPDIGGAFNTLTRNVNLYAQPIWRKYPNDVVGTLAHEATHAGQEALLDRLGSQRFVEEMVPLGAWKRLNAQRGMKEYAEGILKGVGYTEEQLAKMRFSAPVNIAREGQAYLAPAEKFGITSTTSLPPVHRLLNFYRSMILGKP